MTALLSQEELNSYNALIQSCYELRTEEDSDEDMANLAICLLAQAQKVKTVPEPIPYFIEEAVEVVEVVEVAPVEIATLPPVRKKGLSNNQLYKQWYAKSKASKE